MPGRPILFDLSSRNGPICRACLTNIRQRSAQATVWVAPYSSQVSRTPRMKSKVQQRSAEGPRRGVSEEEMLKRLQQMKAAKPDPNVTVRFFEQNGNKRVELEDDGSFEQSLSGMDASLMKDMFASMKENIGNQVERDALDAVLAQMGGSWEGMRTVEDLEAAVNKLDDYGDSLNVELGRKLQSLPRELREEMEGPLAEFFPRIEKMASRAAIPQIPEEPWTTNQRRKIAKLNAALRRVGRDIRRRPSLTDKDVSSVYKAYHMARRSLAQRWAAVPVDVWDFLWKVFSADESINVNRLSHISFLARDMGEAKVELSPSQQLLTIEAVFVDGFEPKALDNWKRCMASLGDVAADTFKDFWELGVRMHCRVGDLDQAQRAVDKLIQHNSDPRILMPIIRTLSERQTPEDHEAAWLAYRQMRELLGQNMKLKDYDQVVSYFLTTNQTENALYAFVDMMTDGQIDLKKHKYYPSAVANKFFVGKWLKRLIGAGDLDGAHSVVEFMRQKGVQAAPIHLNGLLGAWQRSGGAKNVDKAEKLAWQMIEARIEFVRARNSGKVENTFNMVPAPLPRATLETFSVMAENYRVRNLHDRMGELWEAFRDAEMNPDAFMMNQLIESHIQAGQSKEAMALYQDLVHARGVRPDPYTFSALWKTLGVNRLHHIQDEALGSEAEATRRLFAETVSFKAVFEEDGLDGQLARKILHTFRRVRDRAGFLVALATLKQLFGFLPSETLAMEMVLGTTKLSWDTATQRRLLMAAKRDMDGELLAWADGDEAKLEGEKRGVALYDFLQKKFWPDVGSVAGNRIFADAAKDMNVYEALVKKERSN